MNELVVFDEVAVAIAEYKVENDKLVFDYADKEGAKQAKSHMSKLRKVKTKISEVHKEAKAESRAFGLRLDAKKNEYIGEVDKMIKVHKEPLDIIEAELIEKSMAVLRAKEEADEAKRLEMEARERAVILAEEKMAREKAEAEEKVAREKVAENERVIKEQQEKIAKIEEEKRIAEDKVEKVRMKLALEDALKVEAEEERLADIAAEKAIEANRINDEKHRRKIEDEIHSSLTELDGIDADKADNIVIAIKENKIPHITINY